MQHSFEVEDAVKHGVEKAIILNNLRFWLEKNKANNSNAGDGYFWTYNSTSAYEVLFPYLSRSSISRYLNELEKDGHIISSFRSENKLNRTKSYSMPEYAINTNSHNENTIAQSEQSTAQSEQCYRYKQTDINNQILKDKDLKEMSVSAKHDDSSIGMIFDYWRQTMNSPRSRLDANRKRIIKNALKNYSDSDLMIAIHGCSLSPFHMGRNQDSKKYNGIGLIFRNAEKIEMFIGFHANPPIVENSRQPISNIAAAQQVAKSSGITYDPNEPL